MTPLWRQMTSVAATKKMALWHHPAAVMAIGIGAIAWDKGKINRKCRPPNRAFQFISVMFTPLFLLSKGSGQGGARGFPMRGELKFLLRICSCVIDMDVDFKISLASFMKILFIYQLRPTCGSQKYAMCAQVSPNLPRTD